MTMAPHPTPQDQDRRNWRTTPRPAQNVFDEYASHNDVASLLDKEQALDEIASSVMGDVEELAVAVNDAADALCDWEEHLAHKTLQLHADDIRSNEDLRRAMAITTSNSRGIPGRVLYRRYIGTRATVDALRDGLKAKGTVSSDYQTLINGLRKATGLT